MPEEPSAANAGSTTSTTRLDDPAGKARAAAKASTDGDPGEPSYANRTRVDSPGAVSVARLSMVGSAIVHTRLLRPRTRSRTRRKINRLPGPHVEPHCEESEGSCPSPSRQGSPTLGTIRIDCDKRSVKVRRRGDEVAEVGGGADRAELVIDRAAVAAVRTRRGARDRDPGRRRGLPGQLLVEGVVRAARDVVVGAKRMRLRRLDRPTRVGHADLVARRVERVRSGQVGAHVGRGVRGDVVAWVVDAAVDLVGDRGREIAQVVVHRAVGARIEERAAGRVVGAGDLVCRP